MSIEVRAPTVLEQADFYTEPIDAQAMFCDGECVAIGRIVRHINGGFAGLTTAWLDVKPGLSPAVGLAIVRKVKARLKEFNDDVIVTCHVSAYPQAERLLGLLGFLPTEHMDEDRRVWRWQSSHS